MSHTSNQRTLHAPLTKLAYSETLTKDEKIIPRGDVKCDTNFYNER